MGSSASRPGGERPQQEAGPGGGTDGDENTSGNGHNSGAAAGRGFAPQQVVSVHLTAGGDFRPVGAAAGGSLLTDLDLSTSAADAAAAAASHDISQLLQQQRHERFLPTFPRPLPFPSLCPTAPDPLPRLNVQQTCVIKNPVNLLKPTLRCFQEPTSSVPGKDPRLLLSFSLDATTPVEVRVHFFARQIVDASTGDTTFVSAFPSPACSAPSPRRLPAGMKQFFETTYAEGLSVSTWEKQQRLLEATEEQEQQQQEDARVYPVVVCLRSLRETGPAENGEADGKRRNSSTGSCDRRRDSGGRRDSRKQTASGGGGSSSSSAGGAAAAGAGGGGEGASQCAADSNAVKNQYTFAKILRVLPVAAAAAGVPQTREASDDCSSSNNTAEPAAAGPAPGEKKEEETTPQAEWKVQVLKQKVQFGVRVFEVQEIYGIEKGRGSAAAGSFPHAADAGARSSGSGHVPAVSRSSSTAGEEGGGGAAATAAAAEEASQVPHSNGSSSADGRSCSAENDLLSGRECVICLAEERSTAVLPCRHMCLCSGCASIMRMQSNRCPICRHPVTSLLQITMRDTPA